MQIPKKLRNVRCRAVGVGQGFPRDCINSFEHAFSI